MSVPKTKEEHERMVMFSAKLSPSEYQRDFRTIQDSLGAWKTVRKVPLPTISELEQRAMAEAEAREKMKKELRSEIASELAKSVAHQTEAEAPAAKRATEAGTVGKD
jgi:hypothetical protein